MEPRLGNLSRKGTVNIELTGVARSFGGTKAVDGVNLQVGPGVLGLLGPNGAGKTSLLRMLATVLPPTSGEIRLLDLDPKNAAKRREIRRRLGYLPQILRQEVTIVDRVVANPTVWVDPLAEPFVR